MHENNRQSQTNAGENKEELSVDTEGSVDNPWGLSFSDKEGAAYVVLAKDAGLVKARIEAAHVIGHNLLHDIPVLKSMGINIDTNDCSDTMLQAYLLPHLPRRLKALAFRLLNIHQEEYEEIVKKSEEEICTRYLQQVLAEVCKTCGGATTIREPYKRQPNKFKSIKCPACNGDGTSWPTPLPTRDDTTGQLHKPRSIGRSVRAILERGTGLRDGWNAVDEKVRHDVESKLGRLREPTLDDVPLETAVRYSAADADITLRVAHKLEPILKKEGLWQAYEIDKGIIPIIDRMHSNGILIDRDWFMGLDAKFSAEYDDVVAKLSMLGGGRINPASPLQTAGLIYDTLKVRPLRGKRSTDEKTLDTLRIKYKSNAEVQEAMHLIGEARELTKLKGTYVDPLPLWADVYSRIHTSFLLHVVATGRLASRDPNLQNIPTRSERGRLIRKGFIPKAGCKLVSVDLDQIELRVTAHLSQDENMVDVFRTGKDIHKATASLIYGKPMDQITTQERLLSKTINFLILYGGGANRLNNELAILGIETTKDQCVGYINDWFSAYPGARDFIQQQQAAAKSRGYVEDMFGRRRYVQGVWSCIDKVREESLKWATNFPVQATAAGLLKIWMRRIWDNVLPYFWSKGIYCEPLLTIHDEVIFEIQTGYEQELITMVVAEATNSADLLVPVNAKGSSASNWADLK